MKKSRTGKDEHLFFRLYFSKTTAGILRFVIPFFVIAFLNVRMIRFIRLSNKERKEMTIYGFEASVTNIVVAVSFVSLTTLLANLVVLITPDSKSDFSYLFYTEQLLIVLNSSINFVLYCVWGKKFRKEFKKMLCKRGK